jgi:NAD+ kinase
MNFSSLLFVPKIGGAKQDLSHSIISLIKEANASIGRPIEVISSIDDADENTLVIPVGGDGTLVYAAKIAAAKNSKILGINIGKVGFLTDEAPTNMRAFINNVKNEDYTIDRRSLLSVEHLGQKVIAMNDFVISDLYSDSMIDYSMYVAGSFAGKHKANSVIVATPTGSTAYAMYVGGSIIEPDLDVLEIIPVAAMSLTSRPIIVSGNSKINFIVHARDNRTVTFKADGQERGRIDNVDVVITIERCGWVNLIHMDEWNFFSVLNQKLRWSPGSFN